tara:strand:- start:1241 stop:1942 length:702 start_codon:yes stop_codon:yes gene_type:complete
MKLAISQPTFLPWSGYFSLINYVDEIVFLDDIQFDKRSWQQRNIIKTPNGSELITIPVLSKDLFKQNINQVKIDYNTNFLTKIIKTIKQNYSKSQYFKESSNELFEILSSRPKMLLDLNLLLIKWVCKVLDININYSYSSDLALIERKNDLIEAICKKKDAQTYVSTIGSKNYLNDKIFFQENTNTNLIFFDYKNLEYDQLYGKFCKNLSIIDLIFNKGPNSKKVLIENFILI